MYKIANPKKEKVAEVEQKESAVDKHLRQVREKYENTAVKKHVTQAKDYTAIVGDVINKNGKIAEQIKVEKEFLAEYKRKNNIN